MATDVAELQEKVRRLHEQLQHKSGELDQKSAQLQQKSNEVELLQEKVAVLERRLFSRRSEQLSQYDVAQMRMFDEVEQELTAEADKGDVETPQPVAAHTRKRPVRRPLPQQLPRDTVVLDIPESDKVCGCGHQLVRIGEEVQEKLERHPAQAAGDSHGSAQVRMSRLRGLRRRTTPASAHPDPGAGLDPS